MAKKGDPSLETVITEIRSLKKDINRIDRNTNKLLTMYLEHIEKLAATENQAQNNKESIKATNGLLWKFMLASTTISSGFGVVAAVLVRVL